MDVHAVMMERLAYHAWRAERWAAYLLALPEREFTASVPGSFNSARALIAHMAGADAIWQARLQAPGTQPGFPDYRALDRAALLQEFVDVAKAWAGLVQGKDPLEVVRYKNSAGGDYSTPLWQVVLHKVDHNSYHAGQLVVAMRHLNHQPPATNYIFYLRAK